MTPLLCLIKGHKYVVFGMTEDLGYFELKCVRCGKIEVFPREAICEITGHHDYIPIGLTLCKITGWHGSKFRTAKTYECIYCKKTYSDDSTNENAPHLNGWWKYDENRNLVQIPVPQELQDENIDMLKLFGKT